MGFILRQNLAPLVHFLMNVVTRWKCFAMGEQPLGCPCVRSALREWQKPPWRKQMFPVVWQRKNRQEDIWEEGHAKDSSKTAFGVFKGGFSESRDLEWVLLGDSSGEKLRSSRDLPSHHRLLVGVHVLCDDPTEAEVCNLLSWNPSHPLDGVWRVLKDHWEANSDCIKF